ncbi:MAG: hypothetical protein R3190_01815 [Thermoanaerobaculia bacterium]|nr:hypothetical protein [Thermoanaerobaculia bacterium]
MDPGELLRLVTQSLDRLGISYLVTGSTATIAYGEPRLTNDVDIAVRVDSRQAEQIWRAFAAPDFYVDPESARRAVALHSSFNLIHPSSGLKVDFMVTDDSPFNESRFARARPLDLGSGAPARFATPEDAILKKLEYFRDGGSEKHLRDIAGVLRVSGEEIDLAYIRDWARVLDVAKQWEAALEAARQDPGE